MAPHPPSGGERSRCWGTYAGSPAILKPSRRCAMSEAPLQQRRFDQPVHEPRRSALAGLQARVGVTAYSNWQLRTARLRADQPQYSKLRASLQSTPLNATQAPSAPR